MKKKSSKNKTIQIDKEEENRLFLQTISLSQKAKIKEIENKIICGDSTDLNLVQCIPPDTFDLMIIDPPYNLTKRYGTDTFNKMYDNDYIRWFNSFIQGIRHVIKPNGTVYVCSDWTTSNLIYPILEKHFTIKNRITWEREKGRGAKSNWKNCLEDIWFCTLSNKYTFNAEAIKLKKRVIAPYKDNNDNAKDWNDEKDGKFRLTYASNLWTDISIPCWSMPENTDHPTQKPEKLIAKLIIASSNEGDFVFDPFLGSGTTAVVAKKLNRRFCGIEQNCYYAALSMKRLELAEINKSIQGYENGIFYDRNMLIKKTEDEIKQHRAKTNEEKCKNGKLLLNKKFIENLSSFFDEPVDDLDISLKKK